MDWRFWNRENWGSRCSPLISAVLHPSQPWYHKLTSSLPWNAYKFISLRRLGSFFFFLVIPNTSKALHSKLGPVGQTNFHFWKPEQIKKFLWFTLFFYSCLHPKETFSYGTSTICWWIFFISLRCGLLTRGFSLQYTYNVTQFSKDLGTSQYFPTRLSYGACDWWELKFYHMFTLGNFCLQGPLIVFIPVET